MVQLVIVMFRNPPSVSVPILIPLQWLLIRQLEMVTFSHGRSEVLFRHSESSSDSNLQSETTASRQPSMSSPSLQWQAKFMTVTP